MATKSAKEGTGAERRKSRRRPVLDTFSVFLVVPRKGMHKLPVHDLSEHGIGFNLEIEGESLADFPIEKKQGLEVHLYLNQSLFLPLNVEVSRIVQREGVRLIGATFSDRKSKSYKAFAAFLEMLDEILDVVQIVSR